MDFVNRAILLEQILEIVLSGLKREITYVQFHCVLKRKNYRPTEPFPGIGFQTTNERRPPDDLPCSEVKQRNPIRAELSLGLFERQTTINLSCWGELSSYFS